MSRRRFAAGVGYAVDGAHPDALLSFILFYELHGAITDGNVAQAGTACLSDFGITAYGNGGGHDMRAGTGKSDLFGVSGNSEILRGKINRAANRYCVGTAEIIIAII